MSEALYWALRMRRPGHSRGSCCIIAGTLTLIESLVPHVNIFAQWYGSTKARI